MRAERVGRVLLSTCNPRQTIPGSRRACSFTSPHWAPIKQRDHSARGPHLVTAFDVRPRGSRAWRAGPLALRTLVAPSCNGGGIINASPASRLLSRAAWPISRCRDLHGCTGPDALATVSGSRYPISMQITQPKIFWGARARAGWRYSLAAASRQTLRGWPDSCLGHPKRVSSPSLPPRRAPCCPSRMMLPLRERLREPLGHMASSRLIDDGLLDGRPLFKP